jgi:TPR repeat protein
MLELGSLYEGGGGIEADAEKSLAWNQRAAERGSPEAAYRVGLAFSTHSEPWTTTIGKGLKITSTTEGGKAVGSKRPDFEAAAPWLRRAATAGNADAQMLMARLLMNGLGVEEDREAGDRLIELAAEQGHPLAQFLLGLELERGVRRDVDPVRGHMWLSAAAAEEGESEAARHRDRIARTLSTAQRNRSAQLLREWRARDESGG